MDYLQVIERIGIPMFLLVAIGYGFWRGAVWLANEVIKPIAIAHIEWVNEAKKCNTKNSETLEKIGDILEVKATAIANIAANQLETARMVKETRDHLIKGG